MPNLHFDNKSSVPLIGDSLMVTKKVGEGIFRYPFLMGVFPMLTPNPINIAPVNMISSSRSGYSNSYDPWVIPTLIEIESYGTSMSLSLAKQAYSMIQSVEQSYKYESSILLDAELDQYSFPNWETSPSNSHYFLNGTLPSDEAILEVLTLSERPW
jgi:hypothetical protein